MTKLEYNQKLREAIEIAKYGSLEKKIEPKRERILNYIMVIMSLLTIGMFTKCYGGTFYESTDDPTVWIEHTDEEIGLNDDPWEN